MTLRERMYACGLTGAAVLGACLLGTSAPGLAAASSDSLSGAIIRTIAGTSDDGTEAVGTWYADGYSFARDHVGHETACTLLCGLRFQLPELEQGQVVTYARLRLASQGGTLTSEVRLEITGAAEDSPAPFSQSRLPSQLPVTDSTVCWQILEAWHETGTTQPLYYSSPDIASIVNELLARPSWGQGADGKAMAFIMDGCSCPAEEANWVKFEDYSEEFEIRDPAVLEVYPTLWDAFIAKPMLGRPTNGSVTINLMCLVDIDLYAEYGPSPGTYTGATAVVFGQPGGTPAQLELSGLQADSTYYYRIRYRRAGGGEYLAGPEGSFHTQRPRGSPFVFCVEADIHSHMPIMDGGQVPAGSNIDWTLYEHALANIAADRPDFLIDMGDMVDVEGQGYTRNCFTPDEVFDRYLKPRRYTDLITHSVPFYLVLGNHEAEEGWRAINPEDDLEEWGVQARSDLIPNPVPDGFYSGNADTSFCCGPRGDYYAWEWGDALFVVLDPFWYTTEVPHWYTEYPRDADGWAWTLGQDQYNWLHSTLHNSTAAWKFVFCHHETGGILRDNSYYGRGGVEPAKYAVDSLPSFEWGGEDAQGEDVFEIMRPSWQWGPIHDMMVSEGVSIFFHGHDHVFVMQELDGVVYQECPRPKDAGYSSGFYARARYQSGQMRNNSGHLCVSVAQDSVEVTYVRAVLPADEPLVEDGQTIFDGDVCYSYTLINSASVVPRPKERAAPLQVRCAPNPFSKTARVTIRLSDRASVTLSIHDVRGRTVYAVPMPNLAPGTHEVTWQGQTDSSQLVPPGVYLLSVETKGSRQVRKIVLLR